MLALLLWSACHTPPSQAKWEADTLRVFQGVKAREDSAAQRLREADSLKAVAESLTLTARLTFRRGETSYRAALFLRDSLTGLLNGSPDTSGALQVALGAFDSLRVGYDSLHRAFVVLEGSWEASVKANTVLLRAYQLQRDNVDSLTALVRRAPSECRMLRLPCPRLYVGVGLVESGGVIRVGPSIGVGIRVPF